MIDDNRRMADTVLVLRCQMGDERAFERLVAQYGDKIRYFVRRLIGHESDEDDILPSTWLAVWTQLPKLRNPEAFRTWLYRIARNIALQRVRRRTAEVPMEDGLPAQAREEETFSPVESAAVHAALDGISPAHREVLALRFLEGLPYEEIAAVIGCSVGTVRSRIYYGKRSLRKKMEDSGYE